MTKKLNKKNAFEKHSVAFSICWVPCSRSAFEASASRHLLAFSLHSFGLHIIHGDCFYTKKYGTNGGSFHQVVHFLHFLQTRALPEQQIVDRPVEPVGPFGLLANSPVAVLESFWVASWLARVLGEALPGF